MEDIEIYLPWPPSVNRYYAHTRNGVYIGKRGKAYRSAVGEAVSEQTGGLMLECNLIVEVTLFPPDKRARDLDNYMKGLLDALTHAELWEDDRLIDQLFIYRGAIVKDGSVRVEINEAGPTIPFPLA